MICIVWLVPFVFFLFHCLIRAGVTQMHATSVDTYSQSGEVSVDDVHLDGVATNLMNHVHVPESAARFQYASIV